MPLFRGVSVILFPAFPAQAARGDRRRGHGCEPKQSALHVAMLPVAQLGLAC